MSPTIAGKPGQTDMTPTERRTFHVARIITWLPRGGIERRMATLLPRLNEPPFRVSVLCIRERGPLADELEDAGVAVETIPLRSRLDPRGIRALAGWMREQQVDLVHSHMYRSNVPGTIAARLAGIRNVLCQVHNVDTWESGRQRWMDRRLMRWRTAMLAVSEEVKRDVVATLRCPDDKVKVLYNGIDVDRYESTTPNPDLKRELGIEEGRRVLVMLARLHPQKRHTRLLQALEVIRDRIPPTQVLFVGEGALREKLETEVKERGLESIVGFSGHRDDIPQILALADLSVLTSDREGFSNAVVESLAAGVPVVATDVGGNREAVVHGECGYIVPPGDAKALAGALSALLNKDDLRSRMSAAARERAHEFSLDRMLEETRRLYLEILEET